MQAKELMTAPAYSCGRDDMASRAVQIMLDHDCGAVPIVDDHGKVTGMVTDRDICMAAHLRDLPLSAIALETVMSSDICTCGPDDEISEVERRMRERQVRRVPVIDHNGLPLGMLSVADVALGVEHTGDIASDPGRDLAVTVAAISERRPGSNAPQSATTQARQ